MQSRARLLHSISLPSCSCCWELPDSRDRWRECRRKVMVEDACSASSRSVWWSSSYFSWEPPSSSSSDLKLSSELTALKAPRLHLSTICMLQVLKATSSAQLTALATSRILTLNSTIESIQLDQSQQLELKSSEIAKLTKAQQPTLRSWLLWKIFWDAEDGANNKLTTLHSVDIPIVSVTSTIALHYVTFVLSRMLERSWQLPRCLRKLHDWLRKNRGIRMLGSHVGVFLEHHRSLLHLLPSKQAKEGI